MAVRDYVTRHTHYENPKKFSRLAEAVIMALLNHHAAKTGSSAPLLPQGQYLILHSVKDGDYYIPIFVHVRKGYSGHEIFVHPAPLNDHYVDLARAKRVDMPYGARLIEILERALNGERVRPETETERSIIAHLGTKRTTVQYPPMREYGDEYVANHLLQEIAPDTDIYQIDRSKVFVLDYHRRDGQEEVHLWPFDPKVHGPVRLRTVWSEEHYPLHVVSPEQLHEIRRRVGKQRHL